MEPVAVGMISAEPPVAIALYYSVPVPAPFVEIDAFAAPHYRHSCHSTFHSRADSKLKIHIIT